MGILPPPGPLGQHAHTVSLKLQHSPHPRLFVCPEFALALCVYGVLRFRLVLVPQGVDALAPVSFVTAGLLFSAHFPSSFFFSNRAEASPSSVIDQSPSPCSRRKPSACSQSIQCPTSACDTSSVGKWAGFPRYGLPPENDRGVRVLFSGGEGGGSPGPPGTGRHMGPTPKIGPPPPHRSGR